MKRGVIRVEIYSVDWRIRTAAAMTPEAVRKAADFRLTLSGAGEVDAFLSLLPPNSFTNPRKGATNDPRLVIDLINEDGILESYGGNPGRLMRYNDGCTREIDRAFYQRFTLRPVS
jgi:hypothetical protein